MSHTQSQSRSETQTNFENFENERRRTRREVKKLILDTAQNKNELVNPSTDALEQRLRQADEYYMAPIQSSDTATRGSGVPEVALFSEINDLLGGYGEERVRKLKRPTFDAKQYADSVRSYLTFEVGAKRGRDGDLAIPQVERMDYSIDGNQNHVPFFADRDRDGNNQDEIDVWTKFGASVANCFKRTPSVFHMFGPIDAPHPEKRKRTGGRRSARAPIREVQKEHQTGSKDPHSHRSDKMAGELLQYYVKNGGKHIPFIDFVINPNSLSSSVYNCVLLSQNLKKRRAMITIDVNDDEEDDCRRVVVYPHPDLIAEASSASRNKNRVQIQPISPEVLARPTASSSVPLYMDAGLFNYFKKQIGGSGSSGGRGQFFSHNRVVEEDGDDGVEDGDEAGESSEPDSESE